MSLAKNCSPLNPPQPVAGNHSSCSEKTSMSSGPITNVGRQIPIIASDEGM